MRAFLPAVGAAGLACWLAGANPRAAAMLEYRFSFPAPEHRFLQVEAVFPDLGSAPLDLRMSRSSPGRYSLHDFAKNVYDVQAVDAEGKAVALAQPDPYGWRAENYGGTLTVRYKVFGDRVDGTYLAVDRTHAHINMPAVILFARGLDDHAISVRFDPPSAQPAWRAATQLMPGDGPFAFTAPNLQYLMDSPVELGPVAVESFVVDGHTFRFAAHHTGTAQELSAFAQDAAAIVREERAIFGEFPTYEPGAYTFLADYTPSASGDGMEHRNSTVITSSRTIASNRLGLLGTVAHEFFHNWNVERIRPRSLEPFDFERANMSGELWLAEGFTQYYGPLALARTGLADVTTTARTFADLIDAVSGPARALRSAVEMSRMAAFTDGGRPMDRTNWSTTYISYYPFGGAIALALDLTLRERFDGHVTLDDFMRAMWRTHGRPGGSRPGYVDRPYTLADVEARLGEVTESPAFASEFFARYIEGHEMADYGQLLALAGFTLRPASPRAAWMGGRFARGEHGGVRLDSDTVPGTPLYLAGLDRGDEILGLGGARIDSEQRLNDVLRGRKPGDALSLSFADVTGNNQTTTVRLAADPMNEVVPMETIRRSLSPAQQRFRQQWLGSRQ